MFEASEADAIFSESALRLKRFPHMVLECIPLPLSAGETAPIYFKVCESLSFICLFTSLIFVRLFISESFIRV